MRRPYEALHAQVRLADGGILRERGSGAALRHPPGLEHKGMPYELKSISFDAGDFKKPDFLALNPRHRVPVIVDDGFALYESAAIVEYLEDKQPGEFLA